MGKIPGPLDYNLSATECIKGNLAHRVPGDSPGLNQEDQEFEAILGRMKSCLKTTPKPNTNTHTQIKRTKQPQRKGGLHQIWTDL